MLSLGLNRLRDEEAGKPPRPVKTPDEKPLISFRTGRLDVLAGAAVLAAVIGDVNCEIS